MTDIRRFAPPTSSPPPEPDRPRRGEAWTAFVGRWSAWRQEVDRYNTIILRQNHHPQDRVRLDAPNRACVVANILAGLKP